MSELFSNRARCYKLLGQLSEVRPMQSKRDCETALELKDTNVKAHLLCGQVLLCLAKEALSLDLADQGLKRMTRALTLCPSQKLQSYQKELDLYLLRGRKLKWFIQQVNRQTERERLLERVRIAEEGNKGTAESVKTANFLQLQKYLEDPKTELPDYFVCPLSHQLFLDPVLLPSGQSYDRSALLAYFQTNGCFDPASSDPVDPKLLFPNTTLKKAVNDYLDRNPWAFEFVPGQTLSDLVL